MTRFVLVGDGSPTNSALTAAFRRLGHEAEVVTPFAVEEIRRGDDVLVGRVGSRKRLDVVEPHLEALGALERAGGSVLNRAAALRVCRDKLATAERLQSAGIPHPRTALLEDLADAGLEPPVVVKPRFGRDGEDVHLCVDDDDLEATLAALARAAWFRRHGAIVQELVPTGGQDVRVIVAGGRVIGGIRRLAPRGRWHTGGAAGGRCRTRLTRGAAKLALAAAAAVEGDFVGVDLAALWRGQTVIDVNGCVDFTSEYAPDSDAFAQTATALLAAAERQRVKLLGSS